MEVEAEVTTEIAISPGTSSEVHNLAASHLEGGKCYDKVIAVSNLLFKPLLRAFSEIAQSNSDKEVCNSHRPLEMPIDGEASGVIDAAMKQYKETSFRRLAENIVESSDNPIQRVTFEVSNEFESYIQLYTVKTLKKVIEHLNGSKTGLSKLRKADLLNKLVTTIGPKKTAQEGRQNNETSPTDAIKEFNQVLGLLKCDIIIPKTKYRDDSKEIVEDAIDKRPLSEVCKAAPKEEESLNLFRNLKWPTDKQFPFI